MGNVTAIILAAGKGTRMKSEHPKVLHKLFDKSMIECVTESVKDAGIDEQVVIVGYKSEEVVEHLGNKVKYAYQEHQLGTGHAVMQAEDTLNSINGYTLVLNGDAPLITSQTIKNTIEFHKKNEYTCTVITSKLDNPTGYGRIIRDGEGNVLKIVEQKDASESEKKINEVNSGLYCFTTKHLFEALKEINNENAQGEYYLTDTLEILRYKGYKIGAIVVDDPTETQGINSKIQLADLTRIKQQRILKKHMENGVAIIDLNSTFISDDAKIGKDTIIYPGVIIEGECEIGDNCIIGPNTRIINSSICDNCEVQNSVINNSQINDLKIGPFENIVQNRRG